MPKRRLAGERGAHDERHAKRASVIRVKRAYEPKARGDGWRVLVERLWPRGLTKESLAADVWNKDVAPSTELRRWFGHRPERWDEFKRRYEKELTANPDAWGPLRDAAKRRSVTLLYGARDTEHNSAIVLRDFLAERDRGRRTPTQPSRAPSRQATRRRTRTAAQERHGVS